MGYETFVGNDMKQQVMSLLKEQYRENGWNKQDIRDIDQSGEVRYYRYRDILYSNETPQFYEEYRDVYNLGDIISRHYAASIPSGGEGVWDNKADLMTTYGIDMASGTMIVLQTVSPWKEITEIDWNRVQNHSLYGIEGQAEEVQWQALESILDYDSVD